MLFCQDTESSHTTFRASGWAPFAQINIYLLEAVTFTTGPEAGTWRATTRGRSREPSPPGERAAPPGLGGLNLPRTPRRPRAQDFSVGLTGSQPIGSLREGAFLRLGLGWESSGGVHNLPLPSDSRNWIVGPVGEAGRGETKLQDFSETWGTFTRERASSSLRALTKYSIS